MAEQIKETWMKYALLVERFGLKFDTTGWYRKANIETFIVKEHYDQRKRELQKEALIFTPERLVVTDLGEINSVLIRDYDTID